jgi:hypothetical protein
MSTTGRGLQQDGPFVSTKCGLVVVDSNHRPLGYEPSTLDRCANNQPTIDAMVRCAWHCQLLLSEGGFDPPTLRL